MTTPWTHDLRARYDELLTQHRLDLRAHLDGLTEEQARRSLVPSKTTLLGLVKHATYLEAFYFDHAITGRSLQDLGIATTPDRSFTLTKKDTIASVLEDHQDRCAASDAVLAEQSLDATVNGRGPRPLWVIFTQVLRELAHHNGHADILREQIVNHSDAKTR